MVSFDFSLIAQKVSDSIWALLFANTEVRLTDSFAQFSVSTDADIPVACRILGEKL